MGDIQKILLQILSAQYVMIGLLLIISIFMLVIAVRLDAIQVIQKSNRIPQIFSLTVRAAKKLAPRFKNIGVTPTKADVLPQLESAFARLWLADYKTKDGYDKGLMSFTESLWLSSFRLLGGNRDDWKRLMSRWKDEYIVRQAIEGAKYGKGTALIAARDENGMVSKLRGISLHSPANDKAIPDLSQEAA